MLSFDNNFCSKGCVYDGEWENDQINGFGNLKLADGSEYEGDFVAGKFHGQGNYTWKGRAIIIFFLKTILSRMKFQIIKTFEDGSQYIGPFVENKTSGDGTFKDTETRYSY